MSKLILISTQFEHLKDESTYNKNYYINRKDDYKILEICHEDESYCEYFLVENNNEIFLGYADLNMDLGKENIEMDFKVYFT